MKHLKRFNESIEDDIKDLAQHLAYLKDDGFTITFYSMDKFYKWTNYIGISKDQSGFYWEDIKYDILPFVEVLMKNYSVTFIKLYSPNNNGHNNVVIYNNVLNTDNYVIGDFFNEKGIPDDNLIAIEIMFT